MAQFVATRSFPIKLPTNYDTGNDRNALSHTDLIDRIGERGLEWLTCSALNLCVCSFFFFLIPFSLCLFPRLSQPVYIGDIARVVGSRKRISFISAEPDKSASSLGYISGIPDALN